MKTADVCRKHGISGATLYNWKAKYGGLDVSKRQAAEGADRREREAEEAARTCPRFEPRVYEAGRSAR